MTFKNFNQKNDLKLIELSKELTGYQPITVKRDKFYNTISKNYIMNILLKNKPIVNGVKNKSNLSLIGYSDILIGVNLMIQDYLYKKLDGYYANVLDSCVNYEFISENNLPFLSVAMGTCAGQSFWGLQAKKGKVVLNKFKYNKSGEIIKSRNKYTDTEVTDCRCFEIGKAKLIVSDKEKKIFCLSVDNEFLVIVKSADNKYTHVA